MTSLSNLDLEDDADNDQGRDGRRDAADDGEAGSWMRCVLQ